MATRTIVGDGHRALFWEDRWLNGFRIEELAPRVYAWVPCKTRRMRTVFEAIVEGRWATDVGPSVDAETLQQYLLVWPTVAAIELDGHVQDSIVWSSEKEGQFSAKSAYDAKFAGMEVSPMAIFTWKSRAPLRCRFFTWLTIKDRCWTSDRLARRDLPHHDSSPFCDQHDETICHLLLVCVFARTVWPRIFSALGLVQGMPQEGETLTEWCARQGLHGQHAKTVRTICLLAMWEIWKHRNAIVFDGAPPCLREVLRQIARESKGWQLASLLRGDLEAFFVGALEWGHGE